MPICLALLLSVAGFAAGWVTSTHRQKSIIKEREPEPVDEQTIVELSRYALSTIEANRAFMDSARKGLPGSTESRKSN